MTKSMSRISSQTRRDLFPFSPCSLSVLCATRAAGVSAQYCEDMSCAADAPACPHSPPLLHMPSLLAKLRLDPAFQRTDA